MPAPTSALATLRPDLGGSMLEFDLAMDRLGFIGHRLLPTIESQVQSGVFGKIPLEQLLKLPETKRNSRSGYNRGNWEFDDDNFATREYGWEEPTDDRDAKMYANYFDAEMIAAMLALDVVLRAAEKRAADAIFNATTWTGSAKTTGVTNEWDDATNATPIDDVKAAKIKVWEGTGMWPDTLAINRKVFMNLQNCDQIIERIQSAGAGSATKPSDITAAMLASVFDLRQVLVAGSAKNTANEGQTRAISQIWSDEYAMVCKVGETTSIKEPCLGNTIHWAADGSQIGGTMESYYEESHRGSIIRCRHEVQEKIKYVEMGHLLSNITT
jgi:hypothetical protein